jgi:hypothetical protein
MSKENKIIAEFMGVEISSSEDKPTLFWINGWVESDGLRYHTDWNWLMEVVQKIEDLDFIFSIHHEVVNIFNGECSNLIFNETFVGDTKLGTTYLAAVEFIKWYNEQSN